MLDGAFEVEVAGSVEEAAQRPEAVLVCSPAWAHNEAFDALMPVLAVGETVIVSSHVSLGGLYLQRLMIGQDGPVVVWGITVVTGRRTAPLARKLSSLQAKVDAAALPGADA